MSDRPGVTTVLRHPLSSRDGLAFACGFLVALGKMCPKCGYGTRVTSKRWARCTKCGRRVARGFVPPRTEGGKDG